MERRRSLLHFLYWRCISTHPRLRLFLTRCLLPNQTKRISLFGVPLSVHLQKEAGYYRAAQRLASSGFLEEESPALFSLALLLGPKDTFVDVGANVGFYSASLAKLQTVYPSLKIYAFEPNADTATRLRESLKGRNVQIYETALSDAARELDFVCGFASANFGVRRSQTHHFQIADTHYKVKAARLDSFPIEGNSLVIKIDVEGHETEVLRGASAFFDAQRVKAVFIDGYDDPSLPEGLRQRGFRLFNGQSLQPESVDPVGSSLLALHPAHLDLI